MRGYCFAGGPCCWKKVTEIMAIEHRVCVSAPRYRVGFLFNLRQSRFLLPELCQGFGHPGASHHMVSFTCHQSMVNENLAPGMRHIFQFDSSSASIYLIRSEWRLDNSGPSIFKLCIACQTSLSASIVSDTSVRASNNGMPSRIMIHVTLILKSLDISFCIFVKIEV